MDAEKLAKVPPGLPRIKYLARHHPFDFAFIILGLGCVIYVIYDRWPF